MSCNSVNNIEIQDAEIECLSSTFGPSDPDVSLTFDEHTRSGSFCINPNLGCKLRLPVVEKKLQTRNEFFLTNEDTYELSYLPPLSLHFTLPPGYPGTPPNAVGPDFFLSSPWLPNSLLRILNEQLKEAVSENKGEAVLWLLVDIIRTEGEIFYSKLSSSTKEALKLDLDNIYEKYGNEMPLPRTLCYELLVTHNDDQLDIKFRQGYWECSICAETQSGARFFRFPTCKHRFCTSCVRNAFILAIKEGLMSSRIACLECSEDAGPYEVRSVLPDEWYAKYEELTLNHGLSLMRDIITCPRPGCETIVLLDDETLGRCPQCELAFCPLCRRTYHGNVRCVSRPAVHIVTPLTPEDLERLKKEEEQTEAFLAKNTQPCPGCSAPCEKTMGCNKMVCSYCYIYFCWLCLSPIYDIGNPYSHFRTGECAGKLFDGCLV